MTEFSIASSAWMIALFIITPIATFLHELAHALAAHYFTGQPVTIRMGRYAFPFTKVQWGWLGIEISFPWIGGKVHGEAWQSLNPLQRMISAGVAPLTSLILLIILSIVAYAVTDNGLWWRMITQYSAFLLAINVLLSIIPIRYPKWMKMNSVETSDGYKVLESWKQYHAQTRSKSSL
jgi:hypothetical protein